MLNKTSRYQNQVLAALCALIAAVTLTACNPPPELDAQALPTPAGMASAQPHLATADDGSVVLSWLERADESVVLNFARLRDTAWEKPQKVATGNDWFVNWADFPSVVPIRKDLWAAHWLIKRPGSAYSYDVAVALSQDAGAHWGEPVVPHTDGTRTEHGFVSLFPWDDTVGVLWLDGRQTAAERTTHHGGDGGMTLRSARLDAAGRVNEGRLVDNLVCDCCQTDVAITADGPIAVYRNRTATEIRDIYVARTADGQWQDGVPVANDGWHIDGCPVNGPAIIARDRQVAVAWFTAANDQPRVRAAYSGDGGATFAAAIDIDVDKPAGRVDVEWLDADTFVVSWVARGPNDAGVITARAIGPSGPAGPAHVIAHTSTSRFGGFPQMIRHGDALVFAWTDKVGEDSQVFTARRPARAFY